MRHGGHNIRMNEVQEVVAGEGEHQAPEHRRGVSHAAAEEEPCPGPQQRIAGQEFDRNRRRQGQEAVEHQVEGVIHARLAIARHVIAAEQRRHPVERFAPGELLGVERPYRKMERTQVVCRRDAAGNPGYGHGPQDHKSDEDLPEDQPLPVMPKKRIGRARVTAHHERTKPT